MAIKAVGSKWWFVKKIRGKCYRRSTGFPVGTPEAQHAAERRAIEMELAIRAGLHGWTRLGVDTSSQSLVPTAKSGDQPGVRSHHEELMTQAEDQNGEPPEPITREALYCAIWEESLARVSTRYGVSPTYLAGVCDVLRIPRPPKDYWIASRYNERRREPLPPLAVESTPLTWMPPRRPRDVPAPRQHPARPLTSGGLAQRRPAAPQTAWRRRW